MKKVEPKVSIVIPCYNDAAYVEEAVASALGQTYASKEIIIVDDGSDPATKEVLSRIKHPLITLITQENKGPSAARNIGVKNARGIYILPFDADDIFDPSFLEKAVAILDERPDLGVVSCWYDTFVRRGKAIDIFKPTGGGLENFLFRSNAIGTSLYRKKCWEDAEGYDESMNSGYEDWEFWIAVTKKGWSVFIIEEVLFHYRKKPGSVLHKALEHHRETNLQYIFTKHREVYIPRFDKTIEYVIELAKRHQNNEVKRIKSLDYRLGKTILIPIRFIKRLF